MYPGVHQEESSQQVEESDPFLLSTGEAHLKCYVQLWTAAYKKSKEILEQVQWRATKIFGVWSISLMRRHCGSWGFRGAQVWGLEKRRWRGDLIDAYKYLKGAKRMVPDSFPWFTAKGGREMSIN
ncbi:hypothetical protein HGM15179_005518 [Zosterops borbonicus]|uniref:Uncharacterized protein n=1 Tax=Zosterops borbonicus TaxID=364589 RepID=A0A8K1LP74_9PASS|nr:hypothetical protein HGM15179_005518 [Zosterops borbonicus]